MKLIGILNLTPDSFSDGGKYIDFEKAIDQVDRMILEGADIIDIGAESTRPSAKILDSVTEWQRLEKLLPQLIKHIHQANRQVSLDSYHPETIAKALDLGIDYINDVTAFADPRILPLLAKSQAKYVLMHNLGVPVEPDKVMPKDKDIVLEIKNWFLQKLEILEQNNITKDRIIFDVGIGFGKTAEQSFELLKRIAEFRDLDVEIYVGHSRKSFLKNFNWQMSESKDVETAFLSAILSQRNVSYLRVHNVLFSSTLINLASNLA